MYRNCLVDGIFRWSRRGRVDLILVDELGYVQLDRRGAELLFQVLTEREERSAIAIASNGPFSPGQRHSPIRGCAPPSSTD
jgi:DNA replication protein DnaC